MRLEETRIFIIKKLHENFVNSSYYHGVDHSLEVEETCVNICEQDSSISTLEVELLRVAALSHDIGHSEKSVGHEQVGCEFISCYLPQFGYSRSEIETINKLILATKFPHKPSSNLEEIICDADLSYIGNGDYSYQVGKLRKELKEAYNNSFRTDADWLKFQLKFLLEHTFFTEYAKKYFNPKKDKIILRIENELSSQ